MTASSPSAKPPISVSINPSYYCNFRCSFCYLTPEQLGDKKRASVEAILTRIDEIQSQYDIQTVDLYGGEPFLLPEDYLSELKAGLFARDVWDLGVNTNLSTTHPEIWSGDWWISVSYDFTARERSDEVFQNMLSLTQEFSILMLASPELMATDPDEIVDTLNLLSNLESVEVKPYSKNQANSLNAENADYEAFVWSLIERMDRMNFTFINHDQIQDVLAGNRNAYSDDHLYITPEGRFAVLEFDERDREYFLELPSINAYHVWCAQEKTRVTDSACGDCRYLGGCLSEHLRPVGESDQSCSGYYHLIEKVRLHENDDPSR